METQVIFYAHCQALYNTFQEERDINLLESLGFKVVNPNTEANQQYYKINGIQHSLTLLQNCNALAFRSLPDGRIPAGVAYEIKVAKNMWKNIIELPSNILARCINVEETREYLHEVGQR